MPRAPSLDEIVGRFGGRLAGDGTARVARIATLAHADADTISFLANPRYRAQLAQTRAAAVILDEAHAEHCPVACIITDEPYLYFARVAQWLHPSTPPHPGRHASAICETERIAPSAAIGPCVYIGPGAVIGERASIGAGCYVGAGAVIGMDARLAPRSTVMDGCRLGARVIVHAGAVVGADGFGFARRQDGEWLKIPQIGRVRIGDDVEVGANTTIDRGAIEDTVIGDGVKLDNQIQIGHNVTIGAHTAIAGCVGIAGSAHIGRRCTFGGGAIVLGHLEIADDVHVSAGTLVARSIREPGQYTGTVPSLPHREWRRHFAHLRRLDHLATRLRALEKPRKNHANTED